MKTVASIMDTIRNINRYIDAIDTKKELDINDLEDIAEHLMDYRAMLLNLKVKD